MPIDGRQGGAPVDRRWEERLLRDRWRGGMPWRDALVPRGFVLPQNRRASGGRGHPYLRPVVQRVRELVEGTGLSQAAIAARTGVGSATVVRWMRERGWRRPLDACRAPPLVASDRAGLAARLRAGYARVAALAERGSARSDILGAPHAEAAAAGGPRDTRDGRASFEARLRRAPQDEDRELLGLADAARRRARHHDRDGLVRLAPPRRPGGGEPWEPVRVSARPAGPRHLPRGADVVAQARAAWEGTPATRDAIAREIGIAPSSLSRWAQSGGWIRPMGAPSPFGGWARNPGFRLRLRGLEAARLALDEAERSLDALEAGTPLAALAAVFGRLDDATRAVAAPLPPSRGADGPAREAGLSSPAVRRGAGPRR